MLEADLFANEAILKLKNDKIWGKCVRATVCMMLLIPYVKSFQVFFPTVFGTVTDISISLVAHKDNEYFSINADFTSKKKINE